MLPGYLKVSAEICSENSKQIMKFLTESPDPLAYQVNYYCTKYVCVRTCVCAYVCMCVCVYVYVCACSSVDSMRVHSLERKFVGFTKFISLSLRIPSDTKRVQDLYVKNSGKASIGRKQASLALRKAVEIAPTLEGPLAVFLPAFFTECARTNKLAEVCDQMFNYFTVCTRGGGGGW